MMKYLVFKHSTSGHEVLHIFDKEEKHKDVARTLGHSCSSVAGVRLYPEPSWRCVRGGFVAHLEGRLICWGEAFSLGLRSDPDKDTALLLKCLEV